jgi:hypothetical protein
MKEKRNGKNGGNAKTYGGVALLGLARLQGEDDEFFLVSGETLDVEFEALFASVPTAVVDGDADRGGFTALNSSSLELLQGKTATGTQTAVVSDRRTADSGTEEVDGPFREDSIPSTLE